MSGDELGASSRVAGELLLERMRQVEKEDWSLSDDDELKGGQLAGAAANYIVHAADQLANGTQLPAGIPPPLAFHWPHICDSWTWKPKNPRRDLVRAGALIIAEIERLDRAAQNIKTTHGGEPCSHRNSEPLKTPSDS